MDFTPVLDFLNTLAPWVHYLLVILGSITVVGTAIDKTLPDNIDHGFMGKLMAVPYLGDFLKAVSKFSPFNYRS